MRNIAFHLNSIELSLPEDAVCQVWSKLPLKNLSLSNMIYVNFGLNWPNGGGKEIWKNILKLLSDTSLNNLLLLWLVITSLLISVG